MKYRLSICPTCPIEFLAGVEAAELVEAKDERSAWRVGAIDLMDIRMTALVPYLRVEPALRTDDQNLKT